MKKIILVFSCLVAAGAWAQTPQQDSESVTAAAAQTSAPASAPTAEPVVAPAPTPAATANFVWRTIASDKGRSIEVDTASMQRSTDGHVQATSRLNLDKEIVDARTGGSYKYVQTHIRYDCAHRSAATLRRSFLTANEEVLRSDDMKDATFMPVRSGTLDERVMRELCRPPGAQGSAQKRAEQAAEAAAALRQSNEALIKKQLDSLRAAASKSTTAGKQATVYNRATGTGSAASKSVGGANADVVAPPPKKPLTWAYSGPGGPEHWAEVAPENLLCKEGRRQAPIDISDSIAVDLEPLVFDYLPSRFAVTDTGRGIEVELPGNRVGLMGKFYELERVTFQHPAEEAVDGQRFVMGAHLEHRAYDGERLVVAVLLEEGAENPFIQSLLNYLPLEQNRAVMPDAQLVPQQLLPQEQGYHTYMGSMTRPPCDEGVIWAVLQTPVAVSAAQVAVFERLYPHNARPLQPAQGRIIKSSR
ncbi:MAG: carbonic anhydrase family protein [Zoogloeaceae bacterium]|jgi:carbonic anhydrase|nr:carbonic anhydrase family protein [Zoogloeaceae bacterium]